MTPLRILLADDHALVRAGIRALLAQMPDVEVVGEAGDGPEALALVKAHRPDVLLMDIAMAGMSGLEAAAQAKKDCPGVKVIILSMHANEEYVVKALLVGAVGYLLKDAASVELELALKAAVAGQTYLSSAISRQVVVNYVTRAGGIVPPDPLTARQREILLLVAEGKSTKAIAFALGISVKTVETHRAQIMERLDIHDVPGLVKYAMRTGLIPPEW
ncbi:MAG: DNA-binding response regulator [Acidobacteria bacterium RIFCSPLOWO2_12_FULL_65_11]|nr:MAG: DNA-binding response regulator [Acidobacteria bacterium RIFCSPLOWO2_12_FULL_65_11]